MIYKYKETMRSGGVSEFMFNDNKILLRRISDDRLSYNINIHCYTIYDSILTAWSTNNRYKAMINISIDMETDNRYKRYFTYSKIFKISIIE